MPRLSKSAAAEQEPDGDGQPQAFSEMAKFKTPLDYYKHCLLTKLPGYTVAVAELLSAPLPEERKRLWILGSSGSDYTAEHWKQEVEALENLAFPKHHLRGFFERYGQKNSNPSGQQGHQGGRSSWQIEQKYASAFSSAVEQAVNANRLPEDFSPPARHERPSTTLGAGLSPWAQANGDVYSFILSQMEKDVQQYGPLPRPVFPVADVGQSTFRGSVSLSGFWGTLCTSSKLMRMDTWQVLSGKGMLAMLGNKMEDKVLLGLSESELSSLSGNAMAFTQLARVLLPVLAQHLTGGPGMGK